MFVTPGRRKPNVRELIKVPPEAIELTAPSEAVRAKSSPEEMKGATTGDDKVLYYSMKKRELEGE